MDQTSQKWKIQSLMRQMPQLTTHRKMKIWMVCEGYEKFKEFRDSVKIRLHRMEEAITANSNVQKESLLSDNGIETSSGFVVDPLKERIKFLENELKQKDTIMKFLTKKLVEDNCQVVSKGIDANVSLVQSNDSEESSYDSKMIKNSCNDTNEQFKNRKKIIVGDSLLNGINEKCLQKRFEK